MPFFWNQFLLYNCLSVFRPIADAHNTFACIYTGEKQQQLHTYACGAEDIGVPSWRQTVVRSLREESADTLNSHARNIPCLTNLNNKLIDQTALEALGGASCDAARDGWPVAPFPTNSPSSPTDNHPVLSIVCTNHFSASPIRLSVRPYAIQNSAIQVNTVVIRVMSKSFESWGKCP